RGRGIGPMKHMAHSGIAAGTLTAIAALATPTNAGAQSQPMTPWGEPDISGVYAEYTTAPLERPPELGDKEFFTPQELEEWEQQRLAELNSVDDTEPGTAADVHYDMGTFALSENEGVTSQNLRTSIVTMPKNGRIPPLLPKAEARREAREAARRGREF